MKENLPTDNVRFASGFSWLIVSNDPEKTFNEAADHIIYQTNNYTAWLSKQILCPIRCIFTIARNCDKARTQGCRSGYSDNDDSRLLQQGPSNTLLFLDIAPRTVTADVARPIVGRT